MLVSSWTPASMNRTGHRWWGRREIPKNRFLAGYGLGLIQLHNCLGDEDKLPEVISIICQNFIELGSAPSTKSVDKSHLHQRFRIYAEPSSFGRALIQELCLWNPCGVGGTICREKPTKPPVPMEKWRTEMRVHSSRLWAWSLPFPEELVTAPIAALRNLLLSIAECAQGSI